MANYTVTTRVTPWGNSNGLRLPKEVMSLLGLLPNDEVTVTVEGSELVIKKGRISLKEKFKSFDGEYIMDEETRDWSSMPREETELL